MTDEPAPMRHDRGEVLFATIAAGGGHVATAAAMAEAVASASGGELSTRVSDVMAEYGPRELDKRHKQSWRALLSMPRVVRTAQAVMDAAPAVTRLSQDLLLDGFARDVSRRLNESEPALVVVNHGWLATAFTLAKRRHGLRPRVVIYATEPFDASALWSTPDAEVVLAPSTAARESLVAVGVPAARAVVAGYPVADRFLDAPDRATARASLGLDDAFTCLVTLGAEGVADEAAISAVLDLAGEGINVLCVTGRNGALKERLQRGAGTFAAGAAAGRLHPFGFVDDMQRLLAASDVVVGKAGPASTMEALAVGRPVLATAYAGLNELAVTDFLASSGLGGYVGGWERLVAEVRRWRDVGAQGPESNEVADGLDFAAMKRGIGAYLNACADPATSPLAASDLLAPGTFSAVTRADLRRARRTETRRRTATRARR